MDHTVETHGTGTFDSYPSHHDILKIARTSETSTPIDIRHQYERKEIVQITALATAYSWWAHSEAQALLDPESGELSNKHLNPIHYPNRDSLNPEAEYKRHYDQFRLFNIIVDQITHNINPKAASLTALLLRRAAESHDLAEQIEDKLGKNQDVTGEYDLHVRNIWHSLIDRYLVINLARTDDAFDPEVFFAKADGNELYEKARNWRIDNSKNTAYHEIIEESANQAILEAKQWISHHRRRVIDTNTGEANLNEDGVPIMNYEEFENSTQELLKSFAITPFYARQLAVLLRIACYVHDRIELDRDIIRPNEPIPFKRWVDNRHSLNAYYDHLITSRNFSFTQ